MIVATGVEWGVGARLLLEPVSFRISPGDRIGWVGRNGAGKTTLTKVLAGDGLPTAGTVTRTGAVGYLPQDPRTGDLQVLARDRILSARGLDQMVRDLRAAEARMGSADERLRERAMRSYARLDSEFTTMGGYAACLLYTSDAADERSSVDIGGRGIIKKKKKDK